MVEATNSSENRSDLSEATRLSGVAASILHVLRHPSARLILALVALLLLSLPTWRPLASGGFPITYEYAVAPTLLYQMDRCFDDGQLPCRWGADLEKGYGLPVFNYYGPLPYYVGELIHLGGVGFLNTVMVLYIIALAFSALFMFILAREFWGNLGGLVAAVFYVYAPWQASTAYVRGDLPEQWGLAFFPAVLWASYKVIKEGKPVYVFLLALFTCALLLSHNLMVMMLLPLALVWVVAFILATKNTQRFIHLAIAGVGAFSLAAFFTLPVLLERDLVHLERARSDFYYYADHFPTMEQLFLNRTSIEPLTGLPDMAASFQIGWLHWGVAVVSMLMAPLLWRRNRLAFWAIVVCTLFFFVAVFLMNPRSDFIWQTFSWLQWQQFPVRFLGLTIFVSSFLAGAILLLVKQRPYLRLLLSLALIGAVIGVNQQYFHPGERYPTWGQFVGLEWAYGYQSDLAVVQPDYATALPSAPAPAKVKVIGGAADITKIDQGSDSLAFAAESTGGARLEASVVDFPNWRVSLDGEVIPHDHDNDLAAITFDLPPGSHSLELRLEDTTVRTLANYWSLTAWTLLFVSAGVLVARAVWSPFANARRRSGVRAPDIRGSG